MQEQLARLVEASGTTAILVTHSIEEAILLADSILVMTSVQAASRRKSQVLCHATFARDHPSPGYAKLFDQIYGLLRDEVVRAMASEVGSV